MWTLPLLSMSYPMRTVSGKAISTQKKAVSSSLSCVKDIGYESQHRKGKVMLISVLVLLVHMWWIAVWGFLTQNTLLAGLGVSGIIFATIFGLFGEEWADRLVRKMKRKEREIEIPSDIEL